MALTPATLVAAVKAKLESIPGIGIVHDYRREVRDEPTARAVWYHAGQGRIHAWQVSLDEPVAKSTRHPGFGPLGSGQAGTILVEFGVALHAVFGIDDAAASEKTFRDLCWTVTESFNRDGLLSADVVHQEPLQWVEFRYLALADAYLVHYARLTGRYVGRVA